jgi:hypothetical protein
MMLTLATIANIASSIRQSTPKLIPSDGSSFACRSERRFSGHVNAPCDRRRADAGAAEPSAVPDVPPENRARASKVLTT